MISEIDLLKEDIPRLEQKFGSKHYFVEMLKAQLTTLQKHADNQSLSKNNLQSPVKTSS